MAPVMQKLESADGVNQQAAAADRPENPGPSLPARTRETCGINEDSPGVSRDGDDCGAADQEIAHGSFMAEQVMVTCEQRYSHRESSEKEMSADEIRLFLLLTRSHHRKPPFHDRFA